MWIPIYYNTFCSSNVEHLAPAEISLHKCDYHSCLLHRCGTIIYGVYILFKHMAISFTLSHIVIEKIQVVWILILTYSLSFPSGVAIPKRMLPPQHLIDYYSDPKNRGYLADPDLVAKERFILAQVKIL